MRTDPSHRQSESNDDPISGRPDDQRAETEADLEPATVRLPVLAARLAALNQWMAARVSDGLAVAFSGGADSALVLYAACRQRTAADPPIHAVYFRTRLHPAGEEDAAEAMAAAWGARFVVLEIDEWEITGLAAHPRNRCYLCKRTLFERLKQYADSAGARWIADGTHCEDDPAKRPGMQALSELDIQSPLRELNFTKADVRALGAALGIAASRKPSSPCLATRLPYGEPLSPELLQRIDAGEIMLRSLGLADVRLRIHGPVARIEVLPKDMEQILVNRMYVTEKLRILGFHYVTLDLQGFRSGSMDE